MNDYMTYALVAGAAFLLAGPQILEFVKALVPWELLKRNKESSIKGIGFTASLNSLAAVRQRLIDTGGVPKDAESAIEVLTHALLAGSDK